MEWMVLSLIGKSTLLSCSVMPSRRDSQVFQRLNQAEKAAGATGRRGRSGSRENEGALKNCTVRLL